MVEWNRPLTATMTCSEARSFDNAGGGSLDSVFFVLGNTFFPLGSLPDFLYRLPSQTSFDLVLQFIPHVSQCVIHGFRISNHLPRDWFFLVFLWLKHLFPVKLFEKIPFKLFGLYSKVFVWRNISKCAYQSHDRTLTVVFVASFHLNQRIFWPSIESLQRYLWSE